MTTYEKADSWDLLIGGKVVATFYTPYEMVTVQLERGWQSSQRPAMDRSISYATDEGDVVELVPRGSL